MIFSVLTKNLNWEILTKNLVTFQRWDGVKDEKCKYGGSRKNSILGRGFTKKYIGGNCWNRGLGQFADLRGHLAKKRRWCFLVGLIPQCTLWMRTLVHLQDDCRCLRAFTLLNLLTDLMFKTLNLFPYVGYFGPYSR